MICFPLRAGETGAEAVAKLFAPLAESGANEAEKMVGVYIGDGRLGAHVEAHDTAVDFGAREEGSGRDFMQRARAGVELHAHRED